MINKIYKSILITGAADGIGFNLLQRLYQENLKVYALDKNIKKLKTIESKLNIEIINLDLTHTEKVYFVFWSWPLFA